MESHHLLSLLDHESDGGHVSLASSPGQMADREAGLRDVRLHDTRHTTTTVLLILGIPTPTAMAIMGWSSAAMAKRYQHLIDSTRRDVAKQLGGLL